MKNKGITTISLTLALSIGIAFIGGVASFYNVRDEMNKQISTVKERTSVLESQLSNILRSQEKTEKGIEEIRNFLMTK